MKTIVTYILLLCVGIFIGVKFVNGSKIQSIRNTKTIECLNEDNIKIKYNTDA